LGPSLTSVLRANIALRYIPLAWSGTKVILFKPGRNGHILAKNFRPVSLTSFILKTLERLIDRLLKSGLLLLKPFLPNTSIGRTDRLYYPTSSCERGGDAAGSKRR